MKEMRLGRTNLMVSEVGFGGIPIQRLTEERSVEVIRHCLDLGVNYLDTAHGYGTSEERIGLAIAGRREGLILASKGPARDAATFKQQFDLSLKRLGVDYIELYQFHNVATREAMDQVLGPGGAMEAAREAQAAGKIGHIGVTSHSLEIALELVATDQFATMMFPYNFITTEPREKLIPLCRAHDVAFIAMKPMGGGLLEDATSAFKFLREEPDVISLVGVGIRSRDRRDRRHHGVAGRAHGGGHGPHHGLASGTGQPLLPALRLLPALPARDRHLHGAQSTQLCQALSAGADAQRMGSGSGRPGGSLRRVRHL